MATLDQSSLDLIIKMSSSTSTGYKDLADVLGKYQIQLPDASGLGRLYGFWGRLLRRDIAFEKGLEVQFEGLYHDIPDRRYIVTFMKDLVIETASNVRYFNNLLKKIDLDTREMHGKGQKSLYDNAKSIISTGLVPLIEVLPILPSYYKAFTEEHRDQKSTRINHSFMDFFHDKGDSLSSNIGSICLILGKDSNTGALYRLACLDIATQLLRGQRAFEKQPEKYVK